MGIREIFHRPDKQRSMFPDYAVPSMVASTRIEHNPTVSACVGKIANTLSVLPLQLYVHTKGGKSRATFHPMHRVLTNPAYEESATLFYNTLVRHILDGNGYLYKLKSGGKLVGLSLVDPSQVVVSRDSSNRKIFTIAGKVYGTDEILHIPYPGAGYNGLVGVGPATLHKDLISLHDKLLEYISQYFDNSLGNRYALKPGASYNTKTTDIAKFYASFMPAIKKFVQGNANAGQVMIPPPDTDFQEIKQPSNAEGELHSLLKMIESQICLAFNVPPELLDSSQQKYGSLEQKQNDFLSNCIQPLGDHICRCFETLIEDNPTGAFFIQYEYKNLLTTDTATTIDYLAKEVQSGLMTLNEARSKLGLPDVGEAGNFHWLPGNLIPQTMETIEAVMAKQKVTMAQSHNPNGDDK